ncbi:Smr domain containing protein, partial [Acanthamoeba castellanii str. Neff]
YFKEAEEAYAAGDKDKARELREKAKGETAKMEEAQDKAAREVFDKVNKGKGIAAIDLHGQQVKPAMKLLEERLATLAAKHPDVKELSVITGAGNHSGKEGPKIKPAALEYCHSLGIVHSDVKRDNMLWDDQHNQGTLIDFGFSKDRHSPALLRESFHGTKDYMPPEHKNSPAGDMWSAGILLSKLIHSSRSSGSHDAWRTCPSLATAPPTGTLAHTREGEEGLQVNCSALAFVGEEEHACFNEAAHRLLRSLLAQDPRDRPSASQVLQHDWFKLLASESHTDAQELGHATSPLDRSSVALSFSTTSGVGRGT